ncbi:MAG: HEAT repeat domain-containing protein [Pseudomonadota bacterium]|nr:HEAT repeat domain-containing protein [Pseudomonadota bacterium]
MTLLLVLAIVYLRLTLRRALRRETAFIAVWRPLLLEALSQDHLPPLPRLARRDRLFFLKLWNYLQESLRGSATDRLNELARRLQCDHAARKFLKKGNRSERLLAILTLGHLRDQASWDALTLEARKPDRLASIHAARALVKIDPVRGTQWLLPLLLQRRDWDITQIANFLSEARQAFGLQLTARILKIDQQHWTRALQLADALHLELPARTVLFILKNCSAVDTLIAALRLASDVKLRPAVRSHLLHSHWQVRVEVARFLSHFGNASDIPRLQQLLRDRQWWVRYQAAQSLASMPFYGRSQLQALRASTSEVLAIAMLDHVLAEHPHATA